LSRGKKLDFFIGAQIDEGWSELEAQKKDIAPELKEPSKHLLVFKKEKRRGKPVILAGIFFLEKEEANTILKQIKKKLGCGGTYKEGWMEFQGEMQEKLKLELLALGFRFKK
jgi:translation initiation factor 1